MARLPPYQHPKPVFVKNYLTFTQKNIINFSMYFTSDKL